MGRATHLVAGLQSVRAVHRKETALNLLLNTAGRQGTSSRSLVKVCVSNLNDREGSKYHHPLPVKNYDDHDQRILVSIDW